ncbi:ATP-dependent DNA helicase pfh1-like [Chenopodium quinoa]|uniref:ATP-dependent DNA helicase pfh1-like n=1 Tax=Chenopodium quinoa TaxID=63459 RepID=UPI000B76D9E1|nr:ATP-dependent DNA helicase pfh1-like [Chenopodium quinoa]
MLMQFSTSVVTFVRNYSTQIGTRFPIKKPQFANVRIPRISQVPNVEWTDEQLQVFEAVKRCESVFVTGSAGTGKTMLVQELIKTLRKMYGKRYVCVTAPTGVVACTLGGQTLHSFAGVGLAEADAEALLPRVYGNRWVCKRWTMVKALVIDEISMLVVSGDFLQLPPVNVDKNFDNRKVFAFEADSWDCSFQLQVGLKTIFRQTDPELIRLLQGIRRGELDDEGHELLMQRRCSEEPDGAVLRLFPRIEDVDRVNGARLEGVGEEIIFYEAYDSGEKNWIDQLDRGLAPKTLHLCKGARVILTVNLNVKKKLVNGATGTIIGFRKAIRGDIAKICADKLLPIVKFDSGCEMETGTRTWDLVMGDKKCATRMQLPLMLAWAMSVHKSQGMTVDRLHTNLSRAFGFRTIYVALSRLRTLDGFSDLQRVNGDQLAMITSLSENGIPVADAYRVIRDQAGGEANLSFLQRDLYVALSGEKKEFDGCDTK